jgi:hypothetical protein
MEYYDRKSNNKFVIDIIIDYWFDKELKRLALFVSI